jgi:acetoin utilization protein AcuB
MAVLNKELISASIPTLNLSDTVIQALDLMSEFHVMQLPVVAEDKYLGLVFEEDLMNHDERTSLQSLDTHFSKVAVHANTHFIEAVQMLNDYNLSLVPVIDKENEFVGAIAAIDLLKELGKATGLANLAV